MRGSPGVIVLMGVAGSGKTTVGRLLADSPGWSFLDADDLRSPANVEKMRRGVGLDDADRVAWLDAVAAAIAARLAERHGHFAGPALLESQLVALEPPASDVGIARFDVDRPPQEIATAIRAALALEPSAPSVT